MRALQILLADNDLDFLSTFGEILERAGYRVVRACNPYEAEERLRTTCLHLALLDLRLEDDNDSGDSSGLLVAKATTTRVPKLILTRYPTAQAAREALRPDSEGIPPTVDFIDKRWETKDILAAIDQAIASHLHINWDLVIRPSWPAALRGLAALIEPNVDRNDLADQIGELEDLVRMLFNDYRQITVVQLLSSQPGTAVLETIAQDEREHEKRFILFCARRDRVQEEISRYKAYAPKGQGNDNTILADSAETVHFGAVAYELAGADLHEIAPFGIDFRRRPATEVISGLDRLYGETLAGWHGEGRYQDPRGVGELYLEWLGIDAAALQAENLEPKVQAICEQSLKAGVLRVDFASHELNVHFPNRALIRHSNPVRHIARASTRPVPRTVCGVTHGRVTGDTVLLSTSRPAWLIDFVNSGRAPLLCDFVSLEMAVKLDLLETLSLSSRYELERRLLAVTKLDDVIDLAGVSHEVEKGLAVVAHLRRLAARDVGNDILPYMLGLLHCATARLAVFDPRVLYTRAELTPFVHSLLLLALLCEELDQPGTAPGSLPDEAGSGLWIDEAAQDVWVEGRRIEDLTTQEFRLLVYMSKPAGRLCTYQALVEGALGEDFDRLSPQQERDRIHSAMSRLRHKIEPDPANPKYLTPVRGRGYRLDA